MRINVYSQELTSEVALIEKPGTDKEGKPAAFKAVRLMLHSAEQLHHTADDDDRSAVTFWLPKSKERREEFAKSLDRMAQLVRFVPVDPPPLPIEWVIEIPHWMHPEEGGTGVMSHPGYWRVFADCNGRKCEGHDSRITWMMGGNSPADCVQKMVDRIMREFPTDTIKRRFTTDQLAALRITP